MSWSVSFIGKPQDVANALTAEVDKISGQSRIEYESALPHLIAIVKENFTDIGETNYVQPLVHLDASGSGVEKSGVQIHRSLNITLRPMYTKLV